MSFTIAPYVVGGKTKYSCKFPGCNSQFKHPPPPAPYFNKKFHCFPKNLVMCNIWKRICQIPLHDPCFDFRLCGSHFNPGDYMGSRHRLKPTAVPTHAIFPSISSHYIVRNLVNDPLLSTSDVHPPISEQFHNTLTSTCFQIIETTQEVVDRSCRPNLIPVNSSILSTAAETPEVSVESSDYYPVNDMTLYRQVNDISYEQIFGDHTYFKSSDLSPLVNGNNEFAIGGKIDCTRSNSDVLQRDTESAIFDFETIIKKEDIKDEEGSVESENKMSSDDPMSNNGKYDKNSNEMLEKKEKVMTSSDDTILNHRKNAETRERKSIRMASDDKMSHHQNDIELIMICTYCDIGITDPVQCHKCNEYFHPKCLVQSSQLKQVVCKHRVEFSEEFKSESNRETMYLLLIIQEMEDRYVSLKERCQTWKNTALSLERQLASFGNHESES